MRSLSCSVIAARTLVSDLPLPPHHHTNDDEDHPDNEHASDDANKNEYCGHSRLLGHDSHGRSAARTRACCEPINAGLGYDIARKRRLSDGYPCRASRENNGVRNLDLLASYHASDRVLSERSPVCPVANVTCQVAASGAITSIVLALAVSMIDLEAAGRPHLSQNRASSAIVDPQLVQKPISTSICFAGEFQALLLGYLQFIYWRSSSRS